MVYNGFYAAYVFHIYVGDTMHMAKSFHDSTNINESLWSWFGTSIEGT